MLSKSRSVQLLSQSFVFLLVSSCSEAHGPTLDIKVYEPTTMPMPTWLMAAHLTNQVQVTVATYSDPFLPGPPLQPTSMGSTFFYRGSDELWVSTPPMTPATGPARPFMPLELGIDLPANTRGTVKFRVDLLALPMPTPMQTNTVLATACGSANLTSNGIYPANATLGSPDMGVAADAGTVASLDMGVDMGMGLPMPMPMPMGGKPTASECP
jgi:hypothetical protein